MSNNEESMHSSNVKTGRLRALFSPKHVTLHEVPSNLKSKTHEIVDAYPWAVIGVCFGAAGILGYSLGVRS